MARLTLEFHPSVGREIAGAIGWYLERSEAAVDDFILAFDEAVEQIATDPDRAVPAPAARANGSRGKRSRLAKRRLAR
jgi:hypothetical protein